MNIIKYNSQSFPKNYIKALNRLSFKNGIMKQDIIPNINKSKYNFDIYCCFRENGDMIAWAYKGLNSWGSNVGVYVNYKYRRKGIGRALINEIKKGDKNIITAPHNPKSLAFFRNVAPECETWKGALPSELKYSKAWGEVVCK